MKYVQLLQKFESVAKITMVFAKFPGPTGAALLQMLLLELASEQPLVPESEHT
jgi:hypothetical protein